MENKIKWGILSTGHISNKFADALALLPDAELVAVASRDIESALGFTEKHHIQKVPKKEKQFHYSIRIDSQKLSSEFKSVFHFPQNQVHHRFHWMEKYIRIPCYGQSAF